MARVFAAALYLSKKAKKWTSEYEDDCFLFLLCNLQSVPLKFPLNRLPSHLFEGDDQFKPLPYVQGTLRSNVTLRPYTWESLYPFLFTIPWKDEFPPGEWGVSPQKTDEIEKLLESFGPPATPVQDHNPRHQQARNPTKEHKSEVEQPEPKKREEIRADNITISSPVKYDSEDEKNENSVEFDQTEKKAWDDIDKGLNILAAYTGPVDDYNIDDIYSNNNSDDELEQERTVRSAIQERQERQERERKEKERQEKERQEKERQERESQEKREKHERLEKKDRQEKQPDREKQERHERLERQERIEHERLERQERQERIEHERLERQMRIEHERLERQEKQE